MLAKNLWFVVIVLVLIVLAVFGTKFRDRLATPEIIEQGRIQVGCDLTKFPCRAQFADGQMMSFDINPRPIVPLQSLQLSLKFDSLPASDGQLKEQSRINNISVDIVGINMDMGLNRVNLQQQQANSYQGTGILSLCTQSRMEWEARVLIHTDLGIKKVVFPFYTINTQ